MAVAPAGSVFVDGGDWDAGHLSLPASVPKTEREALGNHADANADEDEDEDEDAANNSLYKEEDYHSLVRTQAIVRVGTKWRPGETPIKGQGLQVGYECLCFVERNGGGTKPGGQRGGRHQPGSSDMAPVGRPNHPSGSAGADPSRDMDMAGVSRDEQAEGRTDTKTRTRTTRTRVGTHRHLHVIFQGRYREQEALETEMMLERSEIRCNYCKEIIVF